MHNIRNKFKNFKRSNKKCTKTFIPVLALLEQTNKKLFITHTSLKFWHKL